MPYINSPYQRLLLESLNSRKMVSAVHVRMLNFDWINLSILYQIITKPGFDILHLHWQHSFLLSSSLLKTYVKSMFSIIQFIGLHLLGRKIVWTIHNLKHHENQYSDIELMFSKIIAQIADAIIVHCPTAKKQVQESYKIKDTTKIWVVPHGNFTGIYQNVISKANARAELGISENEFIYLFFGMVRPYKGITDLIKAFKKLKMKASRLLIVGKPKNASSGLEIQKAIGCCEAINVKLEYVRDDSIQIYMNAADILVLPYRDILSTGALLLAMSFGKPVIASSLGCIPDVLEDKGGILYDPDDADGLIEAMERARNEKAGLEMMAKHNLRIADKLEWRYIAESTMDIYNSVLPHG